MDTGAVQRRLRALGAVGLDARADADFEYFARWVCELLGVPVALVSIVHADRQVFPGQYGLVEPWASARETPLTHTLCGQVVATGKPVVVGDVRAEPLDGLVIDALGVVGYAGMPLTVDDGVVLGSLCAIDTEPHTWTPAELDALRDLARSCGTELRLRLARHDAAVARVRSDELQNQVAQSLLQARLLLTASQALSDVSSVSGLRDQIADLVTGDLKPSRVSLVVTQNLGPRSRLEDEQDAGPGSHHHAPDGQWDEFDVAGPSLVAKAAREQQLVHVTDLRGEPGIDEDDRAAYLGGDIMAVTCAPVADSSGVLGVLELAWDRPHDHDAFEHVVIATIAGYVASALQRARYLQHRISVAQALQQAMLTELPEVPGLRLAARYIPADAEEQVGGDWYDAFPLVEPAGAVAVVIGDVTGHDIEAATHMGQLRAMLRQACRDDRHAGGPAAAVTALDRAVTGLGVGTSGTAVVAYLAPAEDGGQELTWTSAGHPPPILIHPDDSVEILHPHDHLIGFADVFRRGRQDHRRTLTPGSTLLFYTDGLVERLSPSIDDEIARLATVAARMRRADPGTLVDAVLRRSAATYRHDDIVLLALHVPAEGGS